MDLTRILDLSRPEKPTALLDRLRRFLPEIATSNANLNSATECDIEIVAVEDGSDASSSTDSDEELEAKANQSHIVMDVTTIVENAPVRMVISDSDSDLDDERQHTLPVGFRAKEPVRKRKQKCFTKEVAEKYVTGKGISNDQEISVETRIEH